MQEKLEVRVQAHDVVIRILIMLSFIPDHGSLPSLSENEARSLALSRIFALYSCIIAHYSDVFHPVLTLILLF